MRELAEVGLTDENIDAAVSFVRGINPDMQKLWGWDTGRFVDFRWGSNNIRADWGTKWFEDHCRVFSDDSGILALTIAEEGGEHICILTREHEPSLTRTLLEMAVKRHRADGRGIALEFSKEADWLRDICRGVGMTETVDSGCEWEYDLESVDTTVRLPDGYRIETLASRPETSRGNIARCIAKAFGSERDLEPVVVNIEKNPMFEPDLSVFAVSPDGDVAAYARGTVDPETGVCGIDPVCTHPDHQKLGLGKAVVRRLFANQLSRDGRFAYIGSAPPPAPGTFLYRSLGPNKRYTACEWRLEAA